MATPLLLRTSKTAQPPLTGLTLLEDEGTVIDRWSEQALFADVELSQKVEQVQEQRSTKPYRKWLVDLSAVKEDADASDAWLYSDLIPFLLNEGYYHIAIVKSRYNYKSKDSVEDIIEIGDRFIGQFEDFEQAFEWVRKQPYVL